MEMIEKKLFTRYKDSRRSYVQHAKECIKVMKLITEYKYISKYLYKKQFLMDVLKKIYDK